MGSFSYSLGRLCGLLFFVALFLVAVPLVAFAEEGGTRLDFQPVVMDIVMSLFAIVSAVIGYAVHRWGRNWSILRDANVRTALLGGVDLALSQAQAMTSQYIGDQKIDVQVKNKMLALAGQLLLANYPKYSKYLKVDEVKARAILERRWGEIEEAKKTGAPVPPADPSIGASNAAPGSPAPLPA